jgi:membrane protein involved in colicin uptake
MSDEIKPTEAPSTPDVSALQAELEKLRQHNESLLNEKKTAQQKAKEAEALAKAEAEAKAKAAGDYESLYKSAEQAKAEYEAKLAEIQQQTANERIRSESLKLATSMADGTNAELLQEFIAKRLKYTDEGVKVVDVNGNLTVSSIDDLKNEFLKSGKYDALLRGSQATGGGAKGSNGNAGGAGKVGNLAGNKQERIAALKQKFSDLS